MVFVLNGGAAGNISREAMGYEFKLKRVYAPPAADDGERILIDRIWPRGLSKTEAALTLWLKDVAPSAALRKWFGHVPSRWPKFQQRYRAELDANPAAVERLHDLLQKGPATLLYGARDEEHNHAIVLANYLTRGKDGANAPG